MNNLGKFLKKRREQKNLTQKQMSDQLGYDNPQFISLMENGHSKVPVDIVPQLCKVLSVKPKAMFVHFMNEYKKEIEVYFR